MDITVAKNSTGAIQLGVINIDPKNPADVELNFPSAVGKRIEGQILTADRMDSRNPIGGAAEVEPQTFSKARWFKGRLRVSMPAKSVVRSHCADGRQLTNSGEEFDCCRCGRTLVGQGDDGRRSL